MKAVILAGGLGTRFSEETSVRPKPMIEIGGKPILWHILKLFSAYGVDEFIVCLGYKGYLIKEYFANYFLHVSDVTFHMGENRMEVHEAKAESWKVTLVDTGERSMTGGRLKRVQKYIGKEDFFFTYGDGLANVDLRNLLAFHKKEKSWATVTAVVPPGRFGSLIVNGARVVDFSEKPAGDGHGRVNGGFFVLNPRVLDLIQNDETVWEREPMEKLSHLNQLSAFPHDGFWQPMDTLRDKTHLENLWNSGQAPWKVWK